MIVTHSREWREKNKFLFPCHHTQKPDTQVLHSGVEAILLLYGWGNEALQGDPTGRGSGGELEPRVSGFHVHSLSVTSTLLKNKMSLADKGEGAFACLYLLLHLCVLTKVLDIKSEVKSGKWQSKWKKLKYLKAIFSLKSILANSVLLEKHSDNLS